MSDRERTEIERSGSESRIVPQRARRTVLKMGAVTVMAAGAGFIPKVTAVATSGARLSPTSPGPLPNLQITGCSPNSGTEGTIVTFTGQGFGTNPDNLCVRCIPANWPTNPSVSARVISAQGTTMQARLLAVLPSTPAGHWNIRRGQGTTVTLHVPGLTSSVPAWSWRGGDNPQDFAACSDLFTPIANPSSPGKGLNRFVYVQPCPPPCTSDARIPSLVPSFLQCSGDPNAYGSLRFPQNPCMCTDVSHWLRDSTLTLDLHFDICCDGTTVTHYDFAAQQLAITACFGFASVVDLACQTIAQCVAPQNPPTSCAMFGFDELHVTVTNGSCAMLSSVDGTLSYDCAVARCDYSCCTVLPTITGFLPTTGVAGDEVTITGTNFDGVTVQFNGTPTSIATVDSCMQVRVTVPAGATTGPISLTTPGGTATSATNFNICFANVSPTLSGFVPTHGTAGVEVTITGADLDHAAVEFNGFSADSVTVDSCTQIRAIAPFAVQTGPISVTTPGGTATFATAFQVP